MDHSAANTRLVWVIPVGVLHLVGELRDIVSRSTPWPPGTRFGSIVTNQNIDVDKPFSTGGT